MSVAAYLLINTATGKEGDVVDALNRINGVKHAHVVTGLHDVICYAEGKDLNELKSIIINDIRGVEGIQRTVTCFALDVSE
ncbi:MAG TPA: Lrp/AsnC family transcriptional regulator [candidate division WOR-3 bacterium]|uniref:Lrp/AsnC family transcriptional regulator n=1 Tax=candidate division WOR-3 bacterium TaxID=2052148 RepID=A0A9C9ENQ4_UNCW3|nr:Lrp/AsnC family transcriptional regulator [candidate division WOR-3 bacterium]